MLKKFFVIGAVAIASAFSGAVSFANETDTIVIPDVIQSSAVELTIPDIVLTYAVHTTAEILDFLIPGADASFMGEIANQIGSGATSEVAVVIAGPVGSIIFYVLAILLIGFVVTSITMWIRHRKQ